MPSPRIALFLPSLSGGGAERVFVELANQFATLGLRVDLTLASAQGPYLPEVSTAVRVIDFNAHSVSRSLPRLVRYLRVERPEALLSGLDHANIVSIFARATSRASTRCVVSMRSVPTAIYGGASCVTDRLIFRLMRLTYPSADAIIANSDAVASDFARLAGARAAKPNVIHNPIDLQSIERLIHENVDHAWIKEGGAPVILGVGSLTAIKDFPTLVRAFSTVRAIRECHLIILGEGPERTKIESLIRELGLQADVWLPGFVRNPFPWMRRSNVFVSASRTEGCPNALMQALACGAHVVATDVGGSAEILQRGKWGRLVAVANADDMAREILSMLDARRNPHVRSRVEDFAIETIARQYLQVLLPGHFGPAVGR